jgi:hypothetical protein
MRRLAFYLIVLFVALAALGYYRNWFTISTNSAGADNHKVGVNVEVDPAKIKGDTEAAGERVKTLGQSVHKNLTALAGGETVKGALVHVEESKRQLTVATADKKEVLISIEDSSILKKKDKAIHLEDLKSGDSVTVVYEVSHGVKVARSVTVDSGA